MLINLSNHPKNRWSSQQISIANELYGEIYDLPFPAIDPKGDENYIHELAELYLQKIINLAQNQTITVHIMGEMNFSFTLIQLLQQHNITCVASTTQRIVEENKLGEKKATFHFERFRKYTF